MLQPEELLHPVERARAARRCRPRRCRAERRPGRGGDAEPAGSGQAQWCPTRTAMPRSSRTWPDVVRVHAVDDEGDALPRGSRSVGPERRAPRPIGQAVEQRVGERLLVGRDAIHAERGEVVDGGAQADGLGGHRHAGLEPLRRRRRRSSPPSGRSRSSSRRSGTAAWRRAARARPHSTPTPLGPSILWPEKARKSTPELGHVDRQVRHRLAGVQHDQRTDLAGPGDERRRPG